MINLLPEPKILRDDNGFTQLFNRFLLQTDSNLEESLLEIANLRLWNHDDIEVCTDSCNDDCIRLQVIPSLEGINTDNEELFYSQGYYLNVTEREIILKYENRAGYIYGITTLIRLLQRRREL